MFKPLQADLAGQPLWLFFNGRAMFELLEIFRGQSVLEAVFMPGLPGLENLAAALAVLAREGELAQRGLGYDPVAIPALEEIRPSIRPLANMQLLRQRVVQAVAAGTRREVQAEQQEVDLGLRQLKNGKDQPLSLPLYLYMAKLGGFAVAEALELPPGLVFDAYEIYLRRNGARPDEEARV